MKHLFLPPNLAKLAKEKGFNDLCFAYYNTVDTNDDYDLNFMNQEEGVDFEGYRNTDYNFSFFFTAPIYAQVVDWLRNKHNILAAAYPFTVFSGDSCVFRYKWAIMQLTAKNLDIKKEIEDETVFGSLSEKECLDIAIGQALNLI